MIKTSVEEWIGQHFLKGVQELIKVFVNYIIETVSVRSEFPTRWRLFLFVALIIALTSRCKSRGALHRASNWLRNVWSMFHNTRVPTRWWPREKKAWRQYTLIVFVMSFL